MNQLVVPVAIVLLAVSCSGAERPTLVGREGALADLSQESTVEAGDEAGLESSETINIPGSTTTVAGGSTTAAIEDQDIRPADGGVRALITPTGVLATVVGETDNAYVVETPCGFQAGVAWGQPLRSVDVMLDPGHGGVAEGAVAESGLTEASVNLRVARRTAALLADRQISVALTRTGDYDVSLAQRANMADALEARALISIHHNAPKSADSAVPGSEVYVQSTSDEAQRLGGLIYEQVVAGLAQFDVAWVARTDAGVLNVLNVDGDDAYAMNRLPASPAALVELGYMANPPEAALFATDDYVATVSQAMATAIEQFLTTTNPGSGFVATPRRLESGSGNGSAGQNDCVDPPLN